MATTPYSFYTLSEEVIKKEHDLLVSTGGLQYLSFFLAPRVEIIKDWLMLSAYVQNRMERMRGSGYDLRHNAWSGQGMIALQHWGFVLSAQYTDLLRVYTEMGNKQAHLITTHGKGFRLPTMQRHQHSWSIDDDKELIAWLLSCK